MSGRQPVQRILGVGQPLPRGDSAAEQLASPLVHAAVRRVASGAVIRQGQLGDLLYLVAPPCFEDGPPVRAVCYVLFSSHANAPCAQASRPASAALTAAEPTGAPGADRRTGPQGRRRRRSTAPPRSGRFLSSTLPYAALLAVSLCGTSAPPERACLVKLRW